jgi:hypothetical protein
MLIYLGVIAFVFNLLDPSKLEESYLAQRGFSIRPEAAPGGHTPRKPFDKKPTQHSIQTELIDYSKFSPKQESSAALELSKIEKHTFSTYSPAKLRLPKAAITRSPRRSGHKIFYNKHSVKSRLFSVSVFPRASLSQLYSPYQLPALRSVTSEKYDTLPVEIVPLPGGSILGLPVIRNEKNESYLSAPPPSSVAPPFRGNLRLKAPSTGTESSYTNQTKKTDSDLPAKDAL